MTDYSTKIAALEAALASGELTVESDGDRVTYRTVGELRQALDYFRVQSSGSGGSGGTSRPATTLAVYRSC